MSDPFKWAPANSLSNIEEKKGNFIQIKRSKSESQLLLSMQGDLQKSLLLRQFCELFHLTYDLLWSLLILSKLAGGHFGFSVCLKGDFQKSRLQASCWHLSCLLILNWLNALKVVCAECKLQKCWYFYLQTAVLSIIFFSSSRYVYIWFEEVLTTISIYIHNWFWDVEMFPPIFRKV